MTSQAPVIDFSIQIIVEPDESGFHAYCPDLKGLHVGGETEEEALENARDAAVAYLRSLIKHGEPIPIGVVASKDEFSVSSHIERLSLTTS